MTRFLALFCALFLAAAPAFAQGDQKDAPNPPEKSKTQKETAPKKDDAKKEASPPASKTPLNAWMDAENAMIEPLSNKQKESVFILRNKHSVIRVIRVVERDVKAAVQSCGKNNPGMKERMDARFKQWRNAVTPILDTAQKQLDKDINAQKMVDAKEFKRVLKLNDAAYEYSEKQIVKKPVTTAEACENLVKSMDRTENEMIMLLRQTLLPESIIREQSEKVGSEDKKTQ